MHKKGLLLLQLEILCWYLPNEHRLTFIPPYGKRSGFLIVIAHVIHECLGGESGTIPLLAISELIGSLVFLGNWFHSDLALGCIPKQEHIFHCVLFKHRSGGFVKRNASQLVESDSGTP